MASPLRLLLLLAVLPASTVVAKAEVAPPPVRPSDASDEIVSIIQLVAAPERFDGKSVRVIGYLDIRFEGTALYLHREDDEYAVTKNGLLIHVPERWHKTPRGYVIVEATFEAPKHGHAGMFEGALLNVTRLDRWARRLTGR
jgi:hypothetical protein